MNQCSVNETSHVKSQSRQPSINSDISWLTKSFLALRAAHQKSKNEAPNNNCLANKQKEGKLVKLKRPNSSYTKENEKCLENQLKVVGHNFGYKEDCESAIVPAKKPVKRPNSNNPMTVVPNNLKISVPKKSNFNHSKQQEALFKLPSQINVTWIEEQKRIEKARRAAAAQKELTWQQRYEKENLSFIHIRESEFRYRNQVSQIKKQKVLEFIKKKEPIVVHQTDISNSKHHKIDHKSSISKEESQAKDDVNSEIESCWKMDSPVKLSVDDMVTEQLKEASEKRTEPPVNEFKFDCPSEHHIEAESQFKNEQVQLDCQPTIDKSKLLEVFDSSVNGTFVVDKEQLIDNLKNIKCLSMNEKLVVKEKLQNSKHEVFDLQTFIDSITGNCEDSQSQSEAKTKLVEKVMQLHNKMSDFRNELETIKSKIDSAEISEMEEIALTSRINLIGLINQNQSIQTLLGRQKLSQLSASEEENNGLIYQELNSQFKQYFSDVVEASAKVDSGESSEVVALFDVLSDFYMVEKTESTAATMSYLIASSSLNGG